jgi:hypothetical protein
VFINNYEAFRACIITRVHARLVLVHLPEREKVLAGLVAALKPRGWIIDEEFDSVSLPPVILF